MYENINKNALVCRHNNLVNASYKLNLVEQRLVLVISSMVNPNDEEFKEYCLSINEFAEIMGIDLNKNKDLYSRIKRQSSILLSKRVTIYESDGDLQTTWFASIKYFETEGKVAFCFAPRLKKYYLQLKEYTKYRLKNITELKSQYSIRIYELLKQYEKIGNRKIDIKELKKILGISENEYKKYYDFKKRVILIAQQELKEKTDISFEFEEIKTGRKVTSIKFIITSGKVKEEVKEQEEEVCVALDEEEKYIKEKVKMVKELIDEDISDIEAIKILEASKGNIGKIIKKYKVILSMNKVDNVVGALIQAIKEDWQEPKKKNKAVIESQFDMIELKKQLLGR